MTANLGEIGIWRWANGLSPELAVEVERLGYGTIWVGGSPPADLEVVDTLLDATSTITVATGIVNMWKDDAASVARSYHRIVDKHPGRFVLGVGVGHPEATKEYRKPYDKMVAYLDELDRAGVAASDVVLAALGPKALRLAAERTAGAHPYLTTPDHTRWARQVVGEGVLLAPEQKVVLDTDPERARNIARPVVSRPYLGLVNYVNNLKRLGWSEQDIADGGSDRLIDALAVHGDAETVARGVREHLRAGADHVCVQALPVDADPLPTYRALAKELL
ncbi:putative F420-dependent oxidoreductase [Saccharomonospora amisosensis]|uniref:Putative F420-dependent oxidoreductase n=1 Tax=Saccharomonospora amisosensis TaxID=1128677 RepID=A0A7X5UVA9_9PSEU|nr:LLM class F420-dependent oxidoreductase [Saccharomonospora amisosensis]NIJ14942.1 putative F420-dependent oxidoreductase [Saccharomonospora amisosensis]